MPAIDALKTQLSQLGSLQPLTGLRSLDSGLDQPDTSFRSFTGERMGTAQPTIDTSPFTTTSRGGLFDENYDFTSSPWGTGATGAANARLLDTSAFDQSLDRLTQQLNPAMTAQPQQSVYGTTGNVASLGGDWAGVDQWNNEIQAAANAYGLDPNLIKAVMKLESNGDPGAGGAPGVVGLMQVYTNVWGNGAWNYDNAANIMKGAEILKYYMDANGGDPYEAMRGYHGYGSDGYTTDTQYADLVMQNYQQLQNAAGQVPTTSYQQYASMNANNPVGNAIVQEAMQYVGVPYVWGGIPGASQNPWDTGWDCSGMTYWLDQKYGGGQLPMGSHFQYQYAQQTGQLFSNTGQLQPGDLLFWDTGNYAGAGADLNNAGHVGIYIGNGQMLHAANPSAGTIVSSLNDYMNMYGFLGAMHSGYSGGTAGGYTGGTTGSTAANNGWGYMRSVFGW